ncbi:DNA repair protein XRCC3 [Pseudoliparis swirei]|uniref:DNA repair protein XRCC3 n=1 Tax=Pseudoliparis swirei TaxID=2059687 RepID=UPI0024BDFD21|nr:DNA repair protein XRCC3 [Pseudoliparis swirei]
MDRHLMELHPRVIAAVRRARLQSFREVLSVSSPDLQRLTGLSASDVQQLLTTAATGCRRHPPVPALLLHRRPEGLRLGLGCPVLDRLLRGGLPVGGVTELSGESGAGKTQLALQLCLSVQYPTQYRGLDSGALYICTEDPFPIRRLQQLIRHQARLRADVPPALVSRLQFSDRVYIEHAADLDSLQVCLSRRAPLLLARGLVRLLVVDSVAALFRSEFQAADWLAKTKRLLTLSSTLHHLSLEFTTPVLCINQVTDVFSSSACVTGPLSSSVAPALGLAWANQVMVRLMMRRLHRTLIHGDQSSALRRLEVVFAPHLPRSGCDAGVWREGVRGASGEGSEERGGGGGSEEQWGRGQMNLTSV